jgi:hypothetical protein
VSGAQTAIDAVSAVCRSKTKKCDGRNSVRIVPAPTGLPWQDRVEGVPMGTRIAFAAALMLSLGLLEACANPESREASQKAAQAAADAKDDAKCRDRGLTPGTTAYDACRSSLAQAQADEAAAQERRRLEFQKTLGAGTSDYSGH